MLCIGFWWLLNFYFLSNLRDVACDCMVCMHKQVFPSNYIYIYFAFKMCSVFQKRYLWTFVRLSINSHFHVSKYQMEIFFPTYIISLIFFVCYYTWFFFIYWQLWRWNFCDKSNWSRWILILFHDLWHCLTWN